MGSEKNEDSTDAALPNSKSESEEGSKAAVSGSATREDRLALVNSSPKGGAEASSAPGVEVAGAPDGNLQGVEGCRPLQCVTTVPDARRRDCQRLAGAQQREFVQRWHGATQRGTELWLRLTKQSTTMPQEPSATGQRSCPSSVLQQ